MVVANVRRVFIVGDGGPEHNTIRSIHLTYDGAVEAWNKLRKKLINDAKGMLEYIKKDKIRSETGMYEEMIKKLSCKDPKKIDNFPHDTPYIQEWEMKV